MFDVSKHSPSNEQLYEPVQLVMLRCQCPVQPAGFVILTVGVVVTMLASPHFVAHENHRDAERKHRDRQEVFGLPIAQLLYSWIVGRTLDAAVPAPVIARAVAVVFPVGFIVFLVVGNEVVEGEAIVTSHKVDTLFGLPLFVTIDFRTAQKAIGEPPYRTLFTPEKAANVIAKAT